MWSRNPGRPGRRAGALALGGLLVAAAGCGFQPMYAERAQPGSGQISPAVRNSVAIAPIPDRIGQQLHNALRDQLNPRGQPTDPAYRLRVRISSVSEPSTLRSDGTATRRSFTLQATWQLDDYDSSRRLFTSSAGARTSYNVVDQPYATVVAFRDAQERVVEQVARDIAARVTGVLARGVRPAQANAAQ
ncbi:hypothetical protein CKO28_24620 [Rhodovibrio sodomensis]|uniref:LPS-assembly lipoprotein LptE n=1 Tax=Rhodovibrio sodomensis TaxID=1088 RepID=A0ABS1DKY3_9PROT|nr:LPS assembly lipoprotein LptE [Rhodovibrio sodomensis]MBK1671191.1 hypothetical protein [Rhodovibrio sodomensis]